MFRFLPTNTPNQSIQFPNGKIGHCNLPSSVLFTAHSNLNVPPPLPETQKMEPGNGFGSISADGARSEFCGDVWRTSKVAKLEETSALNYFHHMEAAQCRNSGYCSSGGLDASAGVYLLSGVRGPFTASQWLELEQQALIYKYIIAKQPIPVHLLLSIRKAFESAGFYGRTLKSTSWGWGAFHQGYSTSTDPEPGRCRRTDGKKWRCSRDAVANQKYCEKHMNRGRHRSRKHVEANKSSTTKPIPPTAAASSTSPTMLPGGGSCKTFDTNQHQHFQGKSLHPVASNPYVNTSLNRMTDLNCSGSSFSIFKHQNCGQERSLNGSELKSQNLLHYYMDGGADQMSIIYSELQSQSGSTHLSMSAPMGPADFMSSTSSPVNGKPDVSPLKLSQEHEIGLGFRYSQSPTQASWKPISWEASMGGPLAEAFQSGNSTDESNSSTPTPSLLPKMWDASGSCQLSSPSPTGELKKSTLMSMSNSSAGSSPRAGNSKTIESSGSFTDLHGSATLN